MPGKLAPGRLADRPPQAGALPWAGEAPGEGPRKVLWAVDAALTAASPVSDIAELTATATAAVRAGNGHVLGSNHVIFPNGAVTLVLILAESHLAIHTWPEENLIAVDLFSCGAIDAGRVVTELVTRLHLTSPRMREVERGAPRPA